MIQKVTSLADFFRKAEMNPEYQNAAIRAYNGVFTGNYNWPMVKDKINEWVIDTVVGEFEYDCSKMVNYLKRFIEDQTIVR